MVSSLIASIVFSHSADGPFLIEQKDGRIVSLRARGDKFGTDYIAPKGALGAVRVSYRKAGGDWTTGDDLSVGSRFENRGNRLIWRVQVKNTSAERRELGGLSMPLPMRTSFDRSSKTGVLKHSFVSGAGSFLFWMRPDSAGPYLTMTCLKGTSLEYWNHDADRNYQVFAHSAAEVPAIQARKGSWRLPHTSRMLGPGETAEYGFAFDWSKDYSAVRDLLAKRGKLDVQVVPGMTVPSDLFAQVALRSGERIEGIEAEFPGQTEIKYLTQRGGYRVYQVRFRRLGENRLTVRQPGGARTYLEFFACQPVETLIKKRAAFLTASQVRDSGKWYNGLLQEWNMDGKVHLNPDNYDRIKGWRIYEVTCDDPGLGKPAYLASKNAEYPVQAEVTALDDYIEHFVWGGLQQTTAEPYPYSIYGIPDWKTLRESKAADKTKGVDHVWRCYDYPHIVLMYREMYRIAAQNPSIKTRLTAREYLERAFGTAQAMFTIPDRLVKWSPYETGYYNEVVIPKLVGDLRSAGMRKEAEVLSAFWVKKVQTFIGGKVDLFASEYAFDSTGFESTEALGDFAVKHPGLADGKKARGFLDRQMAANLFCRGIIEPAYYYLGSDYRGQGGDAYTLSYMAQMGGDSVLDYALHYSVDPSYLRLGYQSFLSSWALMNAGTAASNYGAWYPGVENDGAAGGGFEPAAYGETWLGQPHGRGSWYYSCEIDLGYCGALRAARTTVADDPIFGRFCFGGVGEVKKGGYRFVPRDGVQRRVSVRTARYSADVDVTGGRFVEGALDEKAGTLRLRLELGGKVSVTGGKVSSVGNWVTVRLAKKG